MSSITLPVGELRTFEDGLVALRMPAGRRDRKQIRSWLDRLNALNSRNILMPLRVTERPSGLELEFPDESRRTLPLSAKLAEWSLEPQVAVPEILSLAIFTLGVAAELSSQGVNDVPVGPAYVRFLPGGISAWRLLPVSIEGCSLADWARSEPEAWLWMTSAGLFGGASSEPLHAVGAALHHSFVGMLFSETLSRTEKFSRLLRDRLGLPSRLEGVVKTALPPSCSSDAIFMARLINDCLGPAGPRKISVDDVRRQLQESQQRYTHDRLVRLWEFENRPDIVAKLIHAQRPPEAREPLPPPPAGASWSDVAKQLRDQGRLTEALEAAWGAIKSEGPNYCRLYLEIVQRMVAIFPRPVAEATSALERLNNKFGVHLDESDFLRVVHLKTRYLAMPDEEVASLDRPYESRWNEGVSFLLRAWLLIRTSTGFSQVSRLCKEGRKRFEAMPEGGGAAGAYARSYLYLIDGIAHIGYVSSAGKIDYYADALECFSQSLVLANRVGAADLIRGNVGWFGWLARLTSFHQGPPLSQVHLGIRAILQSHGMLAEALSMSGTPEIPPYNELSLFPI